MKQQFLLVTLALAACSKTSTDPVANKDVLALPSDEGAAADPSGSAENVALADDRTPLEEPNGPIDANSAEAAGQVVQSFGALIEQGRWDEARALWGDAAAGGKFTADLKRNRQTHLEIGKPGEPEGAAGSVYVTVPVILYGEDSAGKDFRRAADTVLRRINDVPGSTEAQRRWHIERIELE